VTVPRKKSNKANTRLAGDIFEQVSLWLLCGQTLQILCSFLLALLLVKPVNLLTYSPQ